MVDPITNDDRKRTLRWAKLATVCLVGLSAGLISIQGEAAVELVAGSVLAGLLVGTGLVWYLFPGADELAPGAGQRYRK
ncbi:MAG: hypothetical protein ACQET5_10950 [Halobacteriota archaeon]|uniref:hypothetical protein n=1 Tax=Natronomonas sp. TaxID=2184060 RepID=UPI003975D9CD